MTNRQSTVDYSNEIYITDKRIKKGKIIYYSQCLEPCAIFEVLELKIRTICENWFVGIENKTKHAYLFYEKDIGKCIFFDREDALSVVKAAEKNCKKKFGDEKFYEEY